MQVVEFRDSKVKVRRPIENTREDWLELLPELPPDAEIALEVSTAGYFAMSVLEEAGWQERAHGVHTAGIDSPRKQKYDRLDAERLARKLAVHHLHPLPEAWFPPPPIRELRLRARPRCWLGGAAGSGQESSAASVGDAWLAAAGKRSLQEPRAGLAAPTKVAPGTGRKCAPDPAPGGRPGQGTAPQRRVPGGRGVAVPGAEPVAHHSWYRAHSGAGDLEE